MQTDREGAYRLTLLIQRMLDAEAICDMEGGALLTEAEAARRCLEAGNAEAARRHIQEVARFTKALVQSGLLDAADGGDVIASAQGMLSQPTEERG